jgi:hypothetical protein
MTPLSTAKPKDTAMSTFGRLATSAMPGFSTDQIAYRVNRFIAQRLSLTSRPETTEQRSCAGAPVSPESRRRSQRGTQTSRFHLLSKNINLDPSTPTILCQAPSPSALG